MGQNLVRAERAASKAQIADSRLGDTYMNEIPLLSSVLAGLRYDPNPQLLWLRFQTGEVYLYRNVPSAVIQAFLDAPSHGKYFNSAVRGHYECDFLS